MKKYAAIFALVCLSLSLAWAKDNDKAKDAVVLPQAFNGWQKAAETAKTTADPAAIDSADAIVLKEYGFTDAETATYTRDDRKIQIKSARFSDAGGAYGAFTFYRQPQMLPEKIGDMAGSNNTRVLFYRGNILVDATLDRVTAMSAADLRALADALPRARGSASGLPNLPANLPQQSLAAQTVHYMSGPVAMERLGVPIPAALVDFQKTPEVADAKYRSSLGEASLTLIDYHTPQIAAERLRTFQAASLPGGPFYYKRSGPLVAIVNGQVSGSEAESLLASVNYDAEVTMNQRTKPDPREDRASFIIALVVLTIIVVFLAGAFGFAWGGLRLFLQKRFPNSVFGRASQPDFIRLDLK